MQSCFSRTDSIFYNTRLSSSSVTNPKFKVSYFFTVPRTFSDFLTEE